MPPSPLELLEFLCADLARKPPALSFRLGASVARYLDDLAYEVNPGTQRQILLLLAKVIWGRVFQFSEFETAAKDETIQFLKDFSQTHLAGYDVTSAIQAVDSSPAPGKHRSPRVLRASDLSTTLGQRGRRITDDLSDRIYAAYWALRLARIRGAAKLVAEALNRHGISTRSRTEDRSWTQEDIRERLKQFEAVLKKGSAEFPAVRQDLVSFWTAYYLSANPPNPPSGR